MVPDSHPNYCAGCPRIVPNNTTATRALYQCCMDRPIFQVVNVTDYELPREQSDTLLLRIPGRSAARGEITHKKFADMNRKERRAFLSGQKR